MGLLYSKSSATDEKTWNSSSLLTGFQHASVKTWLYERIKVDSVTAPWLVVKISQMIKTTDCSLEMTRKLNQGGYDAKCVFNPRKSQKGLISS